MPTPADQPRRRIESIDVVRGIIMIIMALDHTRDYFGGASVNPTDLATTTTALFFTRWITHICAPTFFLLSGMGAWLMGRRRTRADLAVFLFTRGLWLLFLECVLFRFIMQFNFDYHVTILTILWSLGWSMVALAGLVFAPPQVAAVLGVAMIVVHNAFDGIRPHAFGALAPLWTVLHTGGVLLARPGHLVIIGYPLIPWIGVMALGYGLGPLYSMDADRRRTILLRTGTALCVAFVGLRFLNVYGDPSRWSAQPRPWFTVLSFLNATKYPPSLLFLLMTVGPALLLLGVFDRRTPRVLGPALTIGKVPMFYFLLHFTLIHVLAGVALAVRFGGVERIAQSPSPDRFPFTQPPGWPASLPVVYLWWVLVVVLAYPACRWYAGVKGRSTSRWLSYL